jgi:hypothetical protein
MGHYLATGPHVTILYDNYNDELRGVLENVRCLHLVVVVGLVRLCDPESNAGGRATHAGKGKG